MKSDFVVLSVPSSDIEIIGLHQQNANNPPYVPHNEQEREPPLIYEDVLHQVECEVIAILETEQRVNLQKLMSQLIKGRESEREIVKKVLPQILKRSTSKNSTGQLILKSTFNLF